MDGYLFEGAMPVQVLPEALTVGGSWEGHPVVDPPMAHDDDLIEHVCRYLSDFQCPSMIDIGASTGSFSLLPVLLSGLTVFAVEPNPTVYRLLRQHLILNRITDRVETACIAAWHQHEVLTMSVPYTTATGCGTLGKPFNYTPIAQFQVPGVPLDALVDDHAPPVTLVKLDAEGAEKFALQGLKALLERDHPALLVECTWTTGLLFGYPREEILTLVEQAGYRWEWIKEDNAWAVPR